MRRCRILRPGRKSAPGIRLSLLKFYETPRAWKYRLSELRKPENIAAIKRRATEYEERRKLNRSNKKLVEVLAGMEEDDDGPKACLICQL